MLMEMFFAWLAIGFAVLMFLYVAHLCWVGITWLFNAIFLPSSQPTSQTKPSPSQPSPSQPSPSPPSLWEDLQAAERLHQYARFQGWLNEEQNKLFADSLANLKARVSVGLSRRDRPAEAPHSPQPIVSPTETSLSRQDRPAEAITPIQPIILPTPSFPDRSPASNNVGEIGEAVTIANQSTSVTLPLSEASLNAGFDLTQPKLGGGDSRAAVPSHALDLKLELDGKESGRGRPLHGVLRSFMERSNIRWVELISASLVVVCSVGLVISLWSTLSRTSRFFPSLVFMLATLAVHGAGQYTLGRWKLRTTSRGILHIGLMLIPLSVLVGILLAHRQGVQAAFALNATSVMALGVGLIVYSVLAVTATRALFARNFLPIATANILASAALIPIDLVTNTSASILLTAGTLLPVVLVSMLVSLWLSQQAAQRSRWTGAFARRHIGMAVQVLFVTLTACVFWHLKFKPGWQVDSHLMWDKAVDWWWLALGCMGTAWSAWGWSISWPHSGMVSRSRSTAAAAGNAVRIGPSERSVDRDASWFIIAGWILAVIGSAVVAAGLWQANQSRPLLVVMLSIAGLWWVLHGAWIRSSISQFAGCLAAILSGVIFFESKQIGWVEPLTAVQWLGQERIAWLTILSACVVVLATAYVLLTRIFASRSQHRSNETQDERIDHYLIRHLALAAWCLMMVSAGLTVLASCLPIGPTPFGGQWSAQYLVFYGLAISAIAIGVERFDGVMHSSVVARVCAPFLLPVGLAVAILATVRILQASEYVPEWIIALRPHRAWSVGLTSLATACALLAGLLKLFGWQSGHDDHNSSVTTASRPSPSVLSTMRSIDWLNLVSILLAAISLLGVVRLVDHLSLAALVYWQLPILFASIGWTWRSSHAREVATLTAALWSVVVLFSLGASRDWWVELPIMISTCAHLALGCSVSLGITLYINYFMNHRPTDEKLGRTRLFATPFWSSALIGAASLIALLIELGLPALSQLAVSLGMVETGLERSAPGLPFAFALPSFPQSMGVLGTIILWAATVLCSSRLPQQAWQRIALGFTPLLVTLALTACVPAPRALAVCLASLSVALLLSELVSLANVNWMKNSEAAWRLLLSWQSASRPAANALLLGRSINICCLFGVTALTIFLGWNGRLPAELLPIPRDVSLGSEPWTLLSSLLNWMWPAGLFLLVRWLLGTLRNIGPQRLFLIGVIWATLIACAASLAVSDPWFPWLVGTIAWLQWFVIALSIMAGAGPLVVLCRNIFITSPALGLGEFAARRSVEAVAGDKVTEVELSALETAPSLISPERLDSISPKQSLGEVTCGQRWQRAVSCSHQLLRVGLGMMLLLCAIAAVSNAYVPVAIPPSVTFLAHWPTLVAYGAFALVIIWLWRAHLPRGQATRAERIGSYFGLVALLLGMLSPLATVFYADWLELVPARYAVAAKHFEPYRAQLALWLIALALGLVMRWSMTMPRSSSELNDQRLSPNSFAGRLSAELLWLTVACLVGLLALLSCFSDPQPYWPAIELGALALVAVLSGCLSGQAWRGHVAATLAGAACLIGLGLPNLGLDAIWQVLLGPIAVGAISLAWHIYQQRTARSADLNLESREATWWPSSIKSVDQTASLHVPAVICLASCLWVLTADWIATPFDWTMVALAGVGVWLLAIARAWDARGGGRGLAIYTSFIAVALSMSVLVSYFNHLPFMTRGLLWMASGLGALAAVAGILREWLRESPRIIPALRLGNLSTQRGQFDAARRWLVPLHSCIGIVLFVPCLLLALQLDERGLRLANASLPFLGGLAILPIALDPGQRAARCIGLWLASLTLLLFVWADLSPLGFKSSPVDVWIYAHHTMVGLVLLGWTQWALTAWLHGKLDWPAQLARASWISFFGAATVGCGMLMGAGVDAWPHAAQLADLSTQVVWLLAWSGLIGRAAQFALRPIGVDRNASLRQRQAAVYAVEVGLALLAISIYLCFPDSFQGLVAEWWPLIVYGIAMTSAAVGHWAARSNHEVIADPVRRSSLFLPLVPLIGVWMPVSQSMNVDWSDWQRYSLVLLCGAALYAMHGWMKPSIKLRGLAGLLGLCSFWALLHSHPTLRFFEHPQFWIVPPALATLVFVELNRQRLDESVVTAARYVAILLAYLSSTSEIVLKAFEGQMWQPLLLLLLAVAGVLTGIALRVRAFLFCGATFVAVALLGMVWHAQQAIDQVWPWWAFGILTGVSLITMLGYFEKNRPSVLAYVERLKSWQ